MPDHRPADHGGPSATENWHGTRRCDYPGAQRTRPKRRIGRPACRHRQSALHNSPTSAI